MISFEYKSKNGHKKLVQMAAIQIIFYEVALL